MAILRKLQEKLPLMASVSKMPDEPWNEVSLGSRHRQSEKNALLGPQKVDISLFQRAESIIICIISITNRGPTPFNSKNKN
jgi:hypothetical protein